MSGAIRAMNMLTKLKEMGYLIALDDFGTGYSSLSYLKDLPIDELKIDRSFIHDISSNNDNKVLVEAICKMAHQLGLEIVAEGIETEEQFECLKEYGCHYFQGYLFAKPMPQQEFEDFIRMN
jgi:EAL domain-containing protein (putative c-di-GMP-specific phosphodiesterase class I)